MAQKYGAAQQIRTADLFLTKEVLCLLSYNSILADKLYYTIKWRKCQRFFQKTLLQFLADVKQMINFYLIIDVFFEK